MGIFDRFKKILEVDVGKMIEILKSEDSNTAQKEMAANALGLYKEGSEDAIIALMEAFIYDEKSSVKKAANKALGKIFGKPNAIKYFCNVFSKNTNDNIRFFAAFALFLYYAKFQKFAESQEAYYEDVLLEKLDSESESQLIKLLNDDKHIEFDNFLVSALKDIMEEKELNQFSKHMTYSQLAASVLILWGSDLKALLPEIIRLHKKWPNLLLPHSIGHRSHIRKDVNGIFTPFVEHLIITLESNKNEEHREGSAAALGIFSERWLLGEKREDAMIILIKNMKYDPSKTVRELSALSLGCPEFIQEVDQIVPELMISYESDADIRFRAAVLLTIGNFEKNALTALPTLIEGLSKERPVAEAAKISLENISGKTYGHNISKWEKWWAKQTGIPI